MPEPDQAKNTPTLNLYKPDLGEAEWGAALNSDMDILDSALQGLDFTFENINISKLGGNPIDLGKGITGSGTQRVCIANDDTNLTQIELNTRTAATNLTSVSTKLSSPLGVHLLDDLNATMGINNNPLVVYNPLDSDGKFIPLAIRIQSAQGNDLDLGSGVITTSTLRVVSATDDPVVQALQSIDQDFKDSIVSAIYNEKEINIQNVMLREFDGTPIGVQTNPLWTSLMQDGEPISFDFGSGNYTADTLRTVNATNDPNLSAIKTASETLASATGTAGGDIPGRAVQLGKVQETFNEDGDVTNLKLTSIKGDDDGGVYTYVKGGRVGTTLIDEGGDYVGVPDNALFFRNADHPEDRGQTPAKPFFVNITDPVNISNGLNVIQLGGYTISRKRGIIEDGTQRVCIADNDINLSRIVIQIETIIEKIRWIIDHPKVKYTVTSTVASGLGMVAPPYYTVSSGRSATFFLIPESGYQIGTINVDGVDVGNKNPTQTISNITKDMVISVTFTELPAVTYTITTSVFGGSGSISPLGGYVVGQGGTATITMIPATGWKIVAVRVDGVITGSVANTYVIANVQGNHTVSVEFGVNDTSIHTIAASIYLGSGSISPVGDVEVNHGSNQTFNFSPLSGQRVAQVLVDGVPVLGPGATSYTFTNVQDDHEIKVAFESISTTTYSITATIASGLGVISPSGTYTISQGGSITYAFTPAIGNEVSSVTIDGVNMGSITGYTFSNVTANHTVIVTFVTSASQSAGNAIIAGGIAASGVTDVIEYIQIETTSNSGNYGSLRIARGGEMAACSNSVVALIGGGSNEYVAGYAIEKLTIATKGSTSPASRGNVSWNSGSQSIWAFCAASNSTYGFFFEKVSVLKVSLTTGGECIESGWFTEPTNTSGETISRFAAFSSPTRIIRAGGCSASNVPVSIMYYHSFSSGDRGTEFGSLTYARYLVGGCSNQTRGVIGSGYISASNVVRGYDSVTIATLGSTANFGNQQFSYGAYAAASSQIRGVFIGGYGDAALTASIKSMEYITFATANTSSNFGELSVAKRGSAGCSSCHGGL